MKKLALALFILSVAALGLAFSPLTHLSQSPEERARAIVAQDIENMVQSGQAGDFWSSVKDIQIKFSDGSLFHYLSDENLPITKKADGKYVLHIQVLRWIEGHRHGLNMDFEVYDSATENKVAEFGRTYHIGYIW
jgi:hypothetical protein